MRGDLVLPGFRTLPLSMLEQPSLELRAWTQADGPDGRVRALWAGGEQVGLVRQAPLPAPAWLGWLARRTLYVHELPDSSLVFVLRRAWGWPGRWHLFDAEERLVGTLRGRAIFDGSGNLLGVIESPDERGRGRFLAMHGRELGEYVLQGEGLRMTFAPAVEGNPFARMLLLGAALVQDV